MEAFGGMVVVIIAMVVLFAVIITVAAVAGGRRLRERRDGFRQLAAGHGWQFIERDDSYAHRWQGRPFVRNGRSTNILIGAFRGRNFCAFDYRYTTTSTSGDNTTTHTHTFAVFVMALPTSVPTLTVGAEGIFGGKVAEAFGFARVNIPDEDFNNRFKVKCDDPAFGAAVLHPALVQMLKVTGPWDWRLTGADMISHQAGVFEPATVLPRLQLMSDVLDRIPNVVWQGPPPA